MATLSRPIPLPSASRLAGTPFAMNILSHLRVSAGYARFATSSINGLKKVTASAKTGARVSSSTATVLNDSWLASLSCPFERKEEADSESHSGSGSGEVIVGAGSGSEWIIGVDPDVSGALALLRPDQSSLGYSAEVYDSPYVKVKVGKTLRKRLDPRSMVQLLRSFNAPIGTRAYIERSAPIPQDGKQGWWGGGFSYGMWLGVLVASGFSVTPIWSTSWRNFFELSRRSKSNPKQSSSHTNNMEEVSFAVLRIFRRKLKDLVYFLWPTVLDAFWTVQDDSRKAASDMFPLLASALKRKKDHGRAEALLIAAYGKSLTQQFNLNSTSIISEELQLQLCR